MMKLKVLGTGSSGNSYLLFCDTACLVIEAGISLKEVKKSLDFKINKVVGVCVSHIHQDHCKYASDFEKNGIKVFKPFDDSSECISFGDFKIKPFELVHDVLCFGFLIYHPSIGKFLYMSDTEYCPYKLSTINHMLIEANHSRNSVSKHSLVREHILRGHMSIDTACDFIKANDNPELHDVTLCHLSDTNSNEKMFFDMATKSCPGSNVYIAAKGLEIDIESPDWSKK